VKRIYLAEMGPSLCCLSDYIRRLIPMRICSAQRRSVSDKPFEKKVGGSAGIGILVIGASYAVLGGAILVFLGSVVSSNGVV